MAASIARLAGHSAKRLCLRPALPKAASLRAFSAVPSRKAEPYEGTRLIPTDEHFAHPTNPADPQHVNYTPDSNLQEGEGVENRKIRHYTVNFGVSSPAGLKVL